MSDLISFAAQNQGISSFFFSSNIFNGQPSFLQALPFTWGEYSTEDGIMLPEHPVPYLKLGQYTHITPVTISFNGCRFTSPLTGLAGSNMALIRALKAMQKVAPLHLIGTRLDGVVLLENASETVNNADPFGVFNLTLRYYDFSDLIFETIGEPEDTELVRPHSRIVHRARG
ncbi:MAG: hypothetical protein FWE37_02665 [Spirochaetaceae bacterium]|nr:hypothetical protein [Spirochaetaceae bacterium]